MRPATPGPVPNIGSGTCRNVTAPPVARTALRPPKARTPARPDGAYLEEATVWIFRSPLRFPHPPDRQGARLFGRTTPMMCRTPLRCDQARFALRGYTTAGSVSTFTHA